MIVGIPKEMKNNENRVALTPGGAYELVKSGHQVIIEQNAGAASGFADEDYLETGAKILSTSDEIFAQAELIVKVKEPVESEFKKIRPGQTLFTYFHFAADRELTDAMLASGATCIAYETVQKSDRSLPLLTPMSEIAGRTSIQVGAAFLEKPQGGKGILLGGVPGVKPAKVLILGGGIVGTNAAKIAAGMGADVVICDISLPRLRYLEDTLPANVRTLMASEYNIRRELPQVDLVVGAVLVPGGKTPHLLTRSMLSLMEPGTVLVDVAIDQGGTFESSHATTHDEPTYVEEGVIHYCVGNIPGGLPRTSTVALTNATFPYVQALADNGWKKACGVCPELIPGLNMIDGKVTCKNVAAAWNLTYTEPALD
ncbi:MAG: alanine dehydrogenase [Thermoguttaceae bacterium]|nr:alanine dehydrogenase [Thermoguttaceae bacterium]